jgi:hypothetical protein
MTTALHLLRVLVLMHRTASLPDVELTRAAPAVAAALEAETPEFPAELLLAIAWGESRFDSTVHTGRACGIMQTIARRPGDCATWREPRAAFAAGVAELTEWAHDRRTGGNVRLVLLAQACGNAAFDGTCRKTRWPGWVLGRAEQLGYNPQRRSM